MKWALLITTQAFMEAELAKKHVIPGGSMLWSMDEFYASAIQRVERRRLHLPAAEVDLTDLFYS